MEEKKPDGLSRLLDLPFLLAFGHEQEECLDLAFAVRPHPGFFTKGKVVGGPADEIGKLFFLDKLPITKIGFA